MARSVGFILQILNLGLMKIPQYFHYDVYHFSILLSYSGLIFLPHKTLINKRGQYPFLVSA